MPAYLNSTNPLTRQRPASVWPSTPTPAAHFTIGLINNMPDAALESTERQFLSLLDAASGNTHIHVLLFSLPNIPRNGVAADRVKASYSSVEDLWDANVDGLIVTGREPLTPNLTDEPYWGDFTRVLEWAQENTYSTLWSCLAAHAAVLHSDGILRVKAQKKYSGVFDCERVGDHSMTAGMPFRFKLPHSRWNGLPEDALTQRGYQVLARAADGSVDTFVKKYNSLFVYFQGHPEYEPDTLLLEYRRDVGRYLRGESGVYPQLPDGYLDQETAVTLTAMQQEATQRPHPELFPEICRILAGIKIENNWGAGAQRIYANWIEYLRAQKQRDLGHANIGTLNGASNRSKLVAVASGTHRPHVFARGRKGAVTHAKPSQSAAISQ